MFTFVIIIVIIKIVIELTKEETSMTEHKIATKDVDITEFKEGDSWSKQFKVVEAKDNYLIIAKTFKNGKPKKMTQKIIFGNSGDDSSN